jgi:hypothetical protein
LIYVPLLDREFPLKIDLVRRQPNVDEMREEFEVNKQKLQNAQVAAKLVFENFEPGKVGWKGHVCCPAQWAAWRCVEF